MANGHGGKRPNSGPAPGTKYAPTLSKEAAREVVRQLVLEHMRPMVQAQVAHAKGIGHLFTRDKAGKFTKIENMAVAEKLLTEGTEGEDYYIFMKDPSVQAFTDLMNRTLDKPKEQEQEIRITGELEVVAKRLLDGRKRKALTSGKG